MKTNIEKQFDALCEALQRAGVQTDDLRGRSRRYPLVYYRGMIAEQLRKQGYSLPAIGEVFGRSHATILYEIRNLRFLRLPCFAAIRKEYEDFKRICEEGITV